MSGTIPPGFRVLKILVVVMGVSIVAGVAVIGVTIANRLSTFAGDVAKVDACPAAAARTGDIAITLPADARIVETVVTDTRLVLRTDGPGGPRLHLFRLPDGESLGTVTIGR